MQVKKLSSVAVAAIQAVATAAASEERATLAALPVLRAELKGVDRDIVRNTLVNNYAGAVGIKTLVQKSGRIVLDTKDARYDAVSRALRRFIARVVGDESPREAESIAVPAHIAKLAKQLAQACAEYEQSRKLANTAVAEAFAK